jgi:hypothetical protein
MQLSSITHLCLLALPLMPLTSVDSLHFAPEQGDELTVTFLQVGSSSLTENEASFLVNGEEQEGMEAADIQVERTFHETVSFTDTFLTVEEGTPAEVKRVFNEIKSLSTEVVTSPDGEEFEGETSRGSDLQERVLFFTWEDGDDEAAVSYGDEEEGTDEDLLSSLEFTGYLVELLSEDEVSEGDEWELDGKVFRDLIYPGGELSYKDIDEDGDEDSEDAESTFDTDYDENMTGSITLEHMGTREEEGEELTVISFKLDVETFVTEENTEEVNINEQDGESTTTKTFTFTFELEGELLWSEGLNRAVSMQLGGETSFVLEEVKEMIAGELEVELTTSRTFDGEVNYTYTVE